MPRLHELPPAVLAIVAELAGSCPPSRLLSRTCRSRSDRFRAEFDPKICLAGLRNEDGDVAADLVQPAAAWGGSGPLLAQ